MKTVLKKAIMMTAWIMVLPLYLVHRLLCLFANADASFWGFSQLLSLFPGKTGNFLRIAFYRLAMKRCSGDSVILFGTIFSHTDTEIAHGVYIGPQCNIGKCRIEAHCTIGSGVHILSGKQQHVFDDLSTPVQEQGGVIKKVVIGEDTWIGNGALILADIGIKCIIGAGAVVTKRVPDYAIVAGNPARVIGSRLEKKQ